MVKQTKVIFGAEAPTEILLAEYRYKLTPGSNLNHLRKTSTVKHWYVYLYGSVTFVSLTFRMCVFMFLQIVILKFHSLIFFIFFLLGGGGGLISFYLIMIFKTKTKQSKRKKKIKRTLHSFYQKTEQF